MNKDRLRSVLELFQEVVEADEESRAVFLDEACRDDPALRTKVEAMLSADIEAGDFLVEPARIGLAGEWPVDRLVGTRLGHYQIERVVSSGGMGTVYEATQENPRRTVAVKVMRAGITSASAMRRFEYESQILGRLRHPGIAQVFEAGTHGGNGEPGGVPYFVMEYIPDARTVTEYAREQDLGVAERLRLFVQICEAVHHGHQKGIIHRDLKPGNILVDSNGRPKIIDFGVARATESDLALTTMHTEVGQILGTVQYMSPEQCEGDQRDLDTRSDVYSLGVVLYELLCMKLPYDVGDLSIPEAVRRIRDESPGRPSTTIRALRGDVETIVLKALEKDRERRYQSANELGRDIERYLSGEPISARPPSFGYQLRTFARRNRTLVGGVLTVIVVLVAGIIATGTMYIRARREAETARTINAFFNKMLASVDPAQLNIATGFREYEELAPVTTKGVARDVSVVEMMRWAAGRIEETFADKPELEALIRETIGTTFFNLGLFEDARPQLETALAIRRDLFGENHEATLRSMVQLGNLLRMAAQAVPAENLLRPALEGLRRNLGAEHRDTLSCTTILASTLCLQGKLDEGDRLFEKALETQRRVLGEEDRLTLWTMCEWSFDLGRRTESRRAEALASEVYEIALRVLDPDDYITAYAEALEGSFCCWRGDHARAIELLRQAHESRRRFLGEEHPRTAVLKHFIAQSLRGEANLEERMRLYRDATSALRRNLSDGHYWTTVGLSVFLEFLADFGRYEELEVVLRERLASCRKTLGEARPATIDAWKALVCFLLSRGRAVEGRELLHEHLDRIVREHGETHPSTLAALADMGQMLFDLGERGEAREYLERAISGWRGRVTSPEATGMDYNACAWLLLTCDPEDLRDPQAALSTARQAVEMTDGEDPLVLDTLALAYHRNGDGMRAVETEARAIAMLPSQGVGDSRRDLEHDMVRFLLAAGDSEGAGRVLEERRDRVRETVGEESLERRHELLPDLMLLVDEGQYDLAEPRARECLELFEQWARGDPSWQVGWARAILGRCLAGMGRQGEAEPLLVQGYDEIRDYPLPAAAKAIRHAREWIVELYEVTGRPDEAAKLRSTDAGRR